MIVKRLRRIAVDILRGIDIGLRETWWFLIEVPGVPITIGLFVLVLNLDWGACP